MKVKLNSLIRYPITVNFKVMSNGKPVQRILRLVPGKGYEFEEELVDPIDEIRRTIEYSKEVEDMLIKEGIPYDIVKGCGSCSGKRKKIKFPVLEVI